MIDYMRCRVADYAPARLVDDLDEIFMQCKGERNILVGVGYGCTLLSLLYPRIVQHVIATVYLVPLPKAGLLLLPYHVFILYYYSLQLYAI